MVRRTIKHQPDETAAAAHDAFPGDTIEQLLEFLKRHKPCDDELVVTHGDFGTGNVIVYEGALKGFIDVGEMGISDLYYDIYYLLKSLTCYMERHDEIPAFLEAYGLPQFDEHA
ncbi:phosphotransferase [Paenibacillus sp. NPDC057967]|uniref:phosphotransferase n=1 Tax=Paenibacillus sp. NPDC057967 TaxID=3346293 RepID=UPI0036D88FF2